MTIVEVTAALETGTAMHDAQKTAAHVLDYLHRANRLHPGLKMRRPGQRLGVYKIPIPPSYIIDVCEGRKALARGDAGVDVQRDAAWLIQAYVACFGLDRPRPGGDSEKRKRPSIPDATKFYCAAMLINRIDSDAEFWHSSGSRSPITHALQSEARAQGKGFTTVRQRYKESLALLKPANTRFAAEVCRLLTVAGERNPSRQC
ncbi:MAG: hypothetical protein WBW81_02520 [Methylocella sp.]